MDEEFLTIVGDDGSELEVRLVDIIELEGETGPAEYALVIDTEDDEHALILHIVDLGHNEFDLHVVEDEAVIGKVITALEGFVFEVPNEAVA